MYSLSRETGHLMLSQSTFWGKPPRADGLEKGYFVPLMQQSLDLARLGICKVLFYFWGRTGCLPIRKLSS